MITTYLVRKVFRRTAVMCKLSKCYKYYKQIMKSRIPINDAKEELKRILDSLLTQKATGYVFRQSNKTISRDDWDFHEMVSMI